MRRNGEAITNCHGPSLQRLFPARLEGQGCSGSDDIRSALNLSLQVRSWPGQALTPDGPAVAKPRRADITFANMTADPAEVISGDSVFLSIDLINQGTAASGGLTVIVTLPASLESRSFNAPGEQWERVFRTPSWTCLHGPLAPGEVSDTLHLTAGVVGGTPWDVLTVTAQATTTTRELSTDNNTGQASTNLIAAGTIRGKVWVDGNAGPLTGSASPRSPGFRCRSAGRFGVDTCVQESLRNPRVPVLGGKHQRRAALLVSGVGAGAVGKKAAYAAVVSLVGRVHEGGVAVGIARIGLGSACEEILGKRLLAAVGEGHEAGRPVRERVGDIRMRLVEQLHGQLVPTHRRWPDPAGSSPSIPAASWRGPTVSPDGRRGPLAPLNDGVHRGCGVAWWGALGSQRQRLLAACNLRV